MLRLLSLAAVLTLGGVAFAQTAPSDTTPPAKTKARAKKAPQSASDSAAPAPSTSSKTGEQGSPVATETAAPAAPAPAPAAAAPVLDQEEFRRQVMEEVRKELQKAKDEVKQETAWVEQDSQARVQDSEAVEQLKSRVNLFQPHGYLRMRGEFFNNLNLGTGQDPSHNQLFNGPYIGNPPGDSQSDANFRFRFEPTIAVSEDLSIHFQADMLDNVLLGTDPVSDKALDPNTPLNALASSRLSSAVNVKRVWGEVNTALGEFLFGRMGYNWGLGILHNDGNCLDCDYGDTYDRFAFSPREIKGHHFSVMFDLLDKGPSTSGPLNDLGRPVDLDTLDDGYRVAVSVTRVDTAEEIKRKLAAQQWVFNYGLVIDYMTQGWQESTTDQNLIFGGTRSSVAQRGAKFTQPDFFVSLKRKKWRLDAEVASTIGNVTSRANNDQGFGSNIGFTTQQTEIQPVSFLQFGGALQTDITMLTADSLLFGFDMGAASGDKGANGFGARPYRDGSGASNSCGNNCLYQAAGPHDIDGSHINYPLNDPTAKTHGRVNNFVFNRSFNIDMILFRNLVSAITSGWYMKPSMRWRPTGRKSGGGDDSGFELLISAMYAQAWYPENTPSGGVDRTGRVIGGTRPLGLELNAGITYDTSDKFHVGLAYGVLVPFDGMQNGVTLQGPSVAHAVRLLTAIPF
jgi:uncharacterized protein (TIGR04551 family)